MTSTTEIKTDLTIIKQEIRKAVKSRLAAALPHQFTAAGKAAALLLPSIPGWDRFRSVLLFSSMKDEIDTRPIMETVHNAGKPLFIPTVTGETLVFYREPTADTAALAAEDFPALVITPGLSFDRNLNRLGRGRSFYDRFFASLDAVQRDYTAMGICMDCQLVDEVPADPWDKKMDMLLTESGFNMITY